MTYKRAVPDKYVPHDQILDLVIAYGWCDGIKRRVDAERSMQLISPRRTQPWAKSYKDRADRLTANGAMRPTGISAVQQAKATGMWEAVDDVDALIVPDDLRTALQSSSARRPLLQRLPTLHTAQRAPVDRDGKDHRDPNQANSAHRRRGPSQSSSQEQRVTRRRPLRQRTHADATPQAAAGSPLTAQMKSELISPSDELSPATPSGAIA